MKSEETSLPGRFAVYGTVAGKPSVVARFEDNDVWLTQKQVADLFSTTKQLVSHHVRQIIESGELEQKRTVKKYLTVQADVYATATDYDPRADITRRAAKHIPRAKRVREADALAGVRQNMGCLRRLHGGNEDLGDTENVCENPFSKRRGAGGRASSRAVLRQDSGTGLTGLNRVEREELKGSLPVSTRSTRLESTRFNPVNPVLKSCLKTAREDARPPAPLRLETSVPLAYWIPEVRTGTGRRNLAWSTRGNTPGNDGVK